MHNKSKKAFELHLTAQTVRVSFLNEDINMAFNTEDEIEEWYDFEKQRLEQDFLDGINKDKEKIPQFKEKYDAEMKRLIARYKAEHFRLIEESKNKNRRK